MVRYSFFALISTCYESSPDRELGSGSLESTRIRVSYDSANRSGCDTGGGDGGCVEVGLGGREEGRVGCRGGIEGVDGRDLGVDG